MMPKTPVKRLSVKELVTYFGQEQADRLVERYLTARAGLGAMRRPITADELQGFVRVLEGGRDKADVAVFGSVARACFAASPGAKSRAIRWAKESRANLLKDAKNGQRKHK
jgi:hypothetical protein